MFKKIITARLTILKNKLKDCDNERHKTEILKKYYAGKIAIIVGTGPHYKDNVELIKNYFNENCILICTKQSIRDFDMICDFHTTNDCHNEHYDYTIIKPIILYYSHSFPDYDNIRACDADADINFYAHSLRNINHCTKNILASLQLDNELFFWNDKNLGVRDNMCPNVMHIMFALNLPLAINLGCTTIITNGWYGGFLHGTEIANVLKWEGNYEWLNEEQKKEYVYSENLAPYLFENYNVNFYAIGHTNYRVPIINENTFINIIK